MDYRRDIDGLRAVAVMGVILHHAGFEGIRAGYAGVDVFFVISGFLIGGIVAAERAAGRFSFRAFYARRARRILPALFAMILLTLPAAWLLMTPDQLRYFGGGAFSTLIFLSNLWFFNRIDYFNPEAAEDPLIHTWSLAVEEQFYIVLPLLLVLLWRFGRASVLGVLASLAAASLAASVLTSDARPLAAFYLIHTRAWELLAGVLAALLAPRLAAVHGVTQGALATLGLGLVAGGLALIPSEAAWPGAWALVPVAGTVLVVLFGAAPSPARWMLSTAPFVGIGLVSYSAYLWHQPILAFLGIAGEKPEALAGKALAVAAALALAWASWRFVEQPFRTRRLPPRLGRGLLAGAATVIAGVAIGGHVTEGYPKRMSPEVLRILAFETSWSPTYRDCIGGRKEGDRLDPAEACIHGADAPPRVAIWGDSHAAVLAEPLGQALAANGIAVAELTVGSCVPIGELKNSALKRTEYCAEHNRKMLDYLIASQSIEVVVLNAYWNSYAERRDFDTRAGAIREDGVFALPLDATPAMPDDERLAFMTRQLAADVAELTAAGKHVVLLYPLPESAFDPPDRLARMLWLRGEAPAEVGFPTAAFEDYSRLARALLDAAGEGPLIHRIDASGAFCDPGGACRVVEAGVPLFFNANHLSLPGVAKVMPALAGAVRDILAP